MNLVSAVRARLPRAPGEVVLGPLRLAEGTVTLRSPRLSDARAWSGARLANREWLERAFPAWGTDWAAEQSPAAWVTRVRALQHGTVSERSSVLYVILVRSLFFYKK